VSRVGRLCTDLIGLRDCTTADPDARIERNPLEKIANTSHHGRPRRRHPANAG
jgi:hypothetical protein